MVPLLLGTFGYCIVSAFVPVFHAEAYLLTVSALSPAAFRLPLVVAATLGQMTGKAGMYALGLGALQLPGVRTRRWVARAEAWARSKPKAEGWLVFVSAATGLPPFYVVSIACGIMRASFISFLVLGFAGRFLRFGVVIFLPQLVEWFSRAR